MTETLRYPSIKLGSPGEDISKKDLHAISQRFKNLNQLRRQRVQKFLQPRQQVFLDILPLLFHQNHPLLPGFTSSECPVGLPDFTPSNQAIHVAKQFSKGFTHKRKALQRYPIQGIFLMGSVGSIAFSKTSDMDIWLCHQPDLLATEINELQQKSTAIEKWADSLGLEVHFFLVNSETFSKGENIPISVESSGNTQHYLLLEEFYRTAIYIAGRIPAWWLVPPHQEYNYSSYIQHLLENRFISENEVIDFGGLESIPAEEFISATLWHIYKSLNSPHKSLLKLFLMESYASEYPKPQWLCFDLKNAIYQGSINVDSLDPYLLIYAKVEHYLQNQKGAERLNLARQCFYLKIMGGTNSNLDYKSRVLREGYMRNIATQWQWADDLLPALAKQNFWDIGKAIQEHIIIRTQLKHCLRMILKLAGDFVSYNFRENKDLKLLTRKLHAFLERKPGKIEIITTRSAVHTKESELSIVESASNKTHPVWILYSGKFDEKKPHNNRIIKQQPSLIELLVWLVINGLYKKQLVLNFYSHSLTMRKNELQQTLDQLFLFLSKKLISKASSLDVYNKPDKVIASLSIINLGSSHRNEREDGMIVISERSDPLSYGKDRYCFIHHIDRVSVSCWGEVTTYQQSGLDGLFNSLCSVFNTSQHPLSAKSLKHICYTPTRADSILFRISSIFENLIKLFGNPLETNSHRYFLPGERSSYVFYKKDKQLKYRIIDSTEQLLQELATTNAEFGQVYFDPEATDNPVIPFIYSLNKAEIVQIFYLSENNRITVFIIDEKGALFIQQHSNANYNQVLNNYSLFIESISAHSFCQEDIQLKFYELNKLSANAFSAQPAKWQVPPNYMDLSIRIVVEQQAGSSSPPAYYIYCNDMEFSSVEFGNQLFKEISNYIIGFRNSGEKYPIYISDIDIPGALLGSEDETQLQTIHYLNYKKKIEAKLNS